MRTKLTLFLVSGSRTHAQAERRRAPSRPAPIPPPAHAPLDVLFHSNRPVFEPPSGDFRKVVGWWGGRVSALLPETSKLPVTGPYRRGKHPKKLKHYWNLPQSLKYHWSLDAAPPKEDAPFLLTDTDTIFQCSAKIGTARPLDCSVPAPCQDPCQDPSPACHKPAPTRLLLASCVAVAVDELRAAYASVGSPPLVVGAESWLFPRPHGARGVPRDPFEVACQHQSGGMIYPKCDTHRPKAYASVHGRLLTT